MNFIKKESLEDSLSICLNCVEILEKNRFYLNLYPKGEPQLGKRGLYDAMGQQNKDKQSLQLAMLWVLNLSDGTHDLLSIAEKSAMEFDTLSEAAQMLKSCAVIQETPYLPSASKSPDFMPFLKPFPA